MFRFFYTVLFLTLWCTSINAEIIENREIINKKFDIWTVSCEDDEMLNYIRCRLFVEITDGTTLFVNPQSTQNPILLVSNDAYFDRRFFIKIDNNKLITSNDFINNKYGIASFNSADLKTIYNQINTGNFIYIRFTIRDNSSVNGFKEITAKISLAEFQKELIYFNKQVNKYNFNLNNK